MSGLPWIRSRRGVLTLFLGLVLGLALLTFARFRLVTSVADYLPHDDARELYRIGRELADSPLSRTLIFTVAAARRAEAEPASAAAPAREFVTRLRAIDGLLEVRAEPPPDLERAFVDLYFPRRYSMLFEEPELELGRFRGELPALARELRSRLAAPDGALIRRLAPQDPWLVFAKRLEHLQKLQGAAFEVREGLLTTSTGEVVVLATLRDSAFDGEAQAPLLEAIDAAKRAVTERFVGTVIESSGQNRFAVAAERAIRGDVERVSTLSTLVVVAIFLLVYRSLRLSLLAALPLGFGTLAGTAASLLLFGELHAITLAFGVALLGVCIDYPVHFLNELALGGTPDPKQALRRIGRGLVLACATTVLGFVGLGSTSFPGMREIALFSAVGVLGALAVTAWVLPALCVVSPAPSAVQKIALVWALRGLVLLEQRRRWVLFGTMALLLVTGAGLMRLEWNDRLAELSPLDPEVLAESRRVAERTASFDAHRLVVSVGSDLETALVQNDRAAVLLRRASSNGALGGIDSLHDWLWSEARQRQNLGALSQDTSLGPATLEALEEAGFVSQAFAPFQQQLAQPASVLTWAELSSSPLGPLVRRFVLEAEQRVLVVTFLRDVRAPDEVRRVLAELPGVHYLDQAGLLDESYRGFQRETLRAIAFGWLAVTALLLAVYRNVRQVALALAPPTLAALATVGGLALLGQPQNLLHLLGSLLVLGMGVDYALFLGECREGREEGAKTLVSLCVACATTMGSFGGLAFSSVPALSSLGLTVALGSGLSLVLAPSAWVFAEAGHSEQRRAQK